MRTMKAAVFLRPGKIALEEKPVPVAGPAPPTIIGYLKTSAAVWWGAVCQTTTTPVSLAVLPSQLILLTSYWTTELPKRGSKGTVRCTAAITVPSFGATL